jgi:fatty acid desaturase
MSCSNTDSCTRALLTSEPASTAAALPLVLLLPVLLLLELARMRVHTCVHGYRTAQRVFDHTVSQITS